VEEGGKEDVMRVVVTVLSLCVLVGFAAAQDAGQKPDQDPVTITRIECDFVSVWGAVSFGTDDGGFTAAPCDTGGMPVWEWGVSTYVPAPPAPYGPNVWGTVLNGPYGNDSGEGLISPEVAVEVGVNELIELVHYVDTEPNFDGCNVVVIDGSGAETVLEPMAGYPATISTSTSYYAFCVNDELGFTGHDAIWTAACADLSPWDGQVIQLRLDFGSDSSVTYPGWYLAGYTFGTDETTPVEQGSWGTIKGLYR
jgi:hypothetical protein